MKPDHLSRRGFLGGLFVALTAWLCSRPTPAAAMSPPANPIPALPVRTAVQSVSYRYQGDGRRCTTSTYDARDRLVRVADPLPSVSFTYESGTTSSYPGEG
jgi:hypothetical protein